MTTRWVLLKHFDSISLQWPNTTCTPRSRHQPMRQMIMMIHLLPTIYITPFLMFFNSWSTSSNGTYDSFSEAGTSFSGHDPCLEIDADLIDIMDDLPPISGGDCMKGEGVGETTDPVTGGSGGGVRLFEGPFKDRWSISETLPISEIFGEEGYSILDFLRGLPFEALLSLLSL